jgi:hypothetical protein
MDWRDVREGARYRRVDADGNGKGTAREIFGFFSASLVPRPLLPPNPRPPVPPVSSSPACSAAGRWPSFPSPQSCPSWLYFPFSPLPFPWFSPIM